MLVPKILVSKSDFKVLVMLRVSGWRCSKMWGINRCKRCHVTIVTWEKSLQIFSKPLLECETVIC